MTNEEIERIIENMGIDDWGDLDNQYLKSYGIEVVKIIDEGEEITPHSTDINWDKSFVIQLQGSEYSVHMSGTAMANIEYERWTTSSFYRIDEVNVEKKEYIQMTLKDDVRQRREGDAL